MKGDIYITKCEAAIAMAYTGIAFLAGDDFKIFYDYIEYIMGRKVNTFKLIDSAVIESIKKKSYPDFIILCRSIHWEDN